MSRVYVTNLYQNVYLIHEPDKKEAKGKHPQELGENNRGVRTAANGKDQTLHQDQVA